MALPPNGLIARQIKRQAPRQQAVVNPGQPLPVSSSPAASAAADTGATNGTGIPTAPQNPATYTADQRQVDESQTMQGRVASVIDENSALMQRAASKAKEQMNARGLINSSMAIGAGQSAVLDAAMPIAQQDSNIFAQQRIANQQASNEARQFNAGEANKFGLTKLEGQIKSTLADKDIVAAKDRLVTELSSREKLSAADIAAAKERLGMELSSRKDLSQADIAAAMERLGMELESRATLQTEELASREKVAGMEIESADKRLDKEIQSREDLQTQELQYRTDEAAKQRDFERITQLTDQEFKTALANLGYEQELGKMKLGQEFDLAKMSKAQDYEYARLDKASQLEIDRMKEAAEIDLTKLEKAGEIDLKQKEKLLILDNQYQLEKAKTLAALDTEQKKTLMTIEAGFNEKARSSERAATLMNQYMADVGALMRDPNIDAEQKKNMANTMLETMKYSVERIGRIAGTDFSDVFDPNYTGAKKAATPDDIKQAYRDILGRDPDDGGFEFWKNSGADIDSIRREFEWVKKQGLDQVAQPSAGIVGGAMAG